MSVRTERLSVVEKIGYSLGDLAANLIFQTLMTFLAFFYTDVYGISAGYASTIMLAGGLVGAFSSPIVGALADRTQSRWGKFRPWVLWTAVPFGVIALLAFSTPDLGPKAKLAYAFITYIALVIVYSANNLPYSALSGVLTGNMSERNSLSAYRFVAVMVAQFTIQVFLVPLVLILGDGNKAEGFRIAMTFFSIVGMIFFLITFFTTKERIVPPPEQKTSVLVDVADLAKNKPWVIMLAVTVLVFIGLALKNGSYIYYFDNYVDETALAAFLNGIGFNSFIDGLNNLLIGLGLGEFRWPDDASASGFSLFNACGIIMMIVGIGFSRGLADKYGKRNVFGVALIISTFFLFIFFFFPPDAIGTMYIAQILHGFSYGVTIPLLWAMIADVADYSEWKNERRATAIIFSAMIFGLKVGLSVGGSILAGILAFYGYNSGAVAQTPDTVAGIRHAMSIYASLPFLVAGAMLFFYEINKRMERQLESDLAERRTAATQTL